MRLDRLIYPVLFFLVWGLCGLPAAAGSAGWDALNSGISHNNSGQYEQAIIDFTRAIDSGDLSKTNLVRATYNRGVSYDSLGRVKEAIAAYTEALRLQPDFSPALNNRGNAYRRLGRLDDAQQDYWAALAIQGSAAEYSYYGLGMIAQAQGNTDLALGFYNRALKVDPDFKPAQLAAQALAGRPPATQSSALMAQAPPPAHLAEPRPGKAETPALRLGSAERVAGKAEKGERAEKNAKPERDGGESGHGGAIPVQIGSYPEREAAENDWHRLVKKAGGALDGYKPKVVEADVSEKGRVYRLRVSAVSRAEADKLCEALSARNLNCMVLKN